MQTLAYCPFLNCEGVANWRKVSLSVQCFLWMYLFPYLKSLKVLTSTKSILCFTWDVEQQTDGTFEDTLLNVHVIDSMVNLKLFFQSGKYQKKINYLNGEPFWGFLLFLLFIPFTGFPKMTLMFLIISNTNFPSHCFGASPVSIVPSNCDLH
jgi:hypothetical protein